MCLFMSLPQIWPSKTAVCTHLTDMSWIVEAMYPKRLSVLGMFGAPGCAQFPVQGQ